LPPFGWWPLGVLGFGGFAALLHPAVAGAKGPARSRLAVGAGVGLGQYALGLWWVTEFNSAGYVALVLHGTLLTAVAALLVPTRRRWGILLGLPAALIVTDFIRGRFPFGGLPIGGAALGQAAGPLVPAARLGGTLLVTAVAALAGAGLAELSAPGLVRRVAHGDGPPPRTGAERHVRSLAWFWLTGPLLRGAVGLGLVVAIVVAGRLAPDGSGSGPHPFIRVALIQGGGPRGLRGVYVDPQTVFDRQQVATNAVRPPVDLVLWPEDVIQVSQPVGLTPQGSQVAGLATGLQATVVAGVVEDVGVDRFRNAAVAWSAEGTIVARYDKVHRVPFGEYIPGRSLFQHLANLDLVPRDAIVGHGPGLLRTPAGPLAVVISYEVFFEERARAAVKAGGEVLLVPTNAASYSTSQVPTQEVAAAQLRAWETGRDTVQAAPTGYTAVVDHNGRVRARSVLGRQQVLSAVVERRRGRTVFVQLGDLPFVAVAIAGLLAARSPWGRRYRFSHSNPDRLYGEPMPIPNGGSSPPPPAG
jgi:apolipoprotein N-acyltransferase